MYRSQDPKESSHFITFSCLFLTYSLRHLLSISFNNSRITVLGKYSFRRSEEMHTGTGKAKFSYQCQY